MQQKLSCDNPTHTEARIFLLPRSPLHVFCSSENVQIMWCFKYFFESPGHNSWFNIIRLSAIWRNLWGFNWSDPQISWMPHPKAETGVLCPNTSCPLNRLGQIAFLTGFGSLARAMSKPSWVFPLHFGWVHICPTLITCINRSTRSKI